LPTIVHCLMSHGAILRKLWHLCILFRCLVART
jgi:hypothetical protein